ncbi:MAG: YHS domain-containing protein [Saprospiraceae bacterium]|nr:YHS domain-containing protein [Saprospiraceae bacterium]
MKNYSVILLFLGVVLLAACKHQTPSNTTQTTTEQPATEKASTVVLDNTIDPICEMSVDGTAEDTVHYQGKVYGFCSEHCKKEFMEEPGKYLSAMK